MQRFIKISHVLNNLTIHCTRSSAVAEGPRDASCQLKSCHLPRNSAETAYTTPVEFRGDLWHQKTRLPGLSCGVVCVILRLAVLVELRLVTDRQTDRETDRPMASTADA